MTDSIVNKFKNEVLKLKGKKDISQKIMRAFLDRMEKGKLIREENPEDHFCSFFIPVDRSTQMVFVGHHIKADDWIPPGGHIDPNESPRDTIYREFYEELKYTLRDEKVELFDICAIPVRKTTRPCKTHYDFWYRVFIGKVDFDYDRGEFHEALWLPIDEAITRVKRDVYREVLQKLGDTI